MRARTTRGVCNPRRPTAKNWYYQPSPKCPDNSAPIRIRPASAFSLFLSKFLPELLSLHHRFTETTHKTPASSRTHPLHSLHSLILFCSRSIPPHSTAEAAAANATRCDASHSRTRRGQSHTIRARARALQRSCGCGGHRRSARLLKWPVVRHFSQPP